MRVLFDSSALVKVDTPYHRFTQGGYANDELRLSMSIPCQKQVEEEADFDLYSTMSFDGIHSNEVAPLFVREGKFPKRSVEHYHNDFVVHIPVDGQEVTPSRSQISVEGGSLLDFALGTTTSRGIQYTAVWVDGYNSYHPSGTVSHRWHWHCCCLAFYDPGLGEYGLCYTVTDTNDGNKSFSDMLSLASSLVDTRAGRGDPHWFEAPVATQVLIHFHPSRETQKAFLNRVDKIVQDSWHSYWMEEIVPQDANRFDEALANYTGPNMSWLEFIIPFKDIPDSLKAMGVIPKTLKELCGYFLNYKYGVATLPSDITEFWETFSQFMIRCTEDYVGIQTLRARGSIKDETRALSGKWNVSVRGSIANHAAMAAAHLGVADPISEIWNCIPYSFVIDWFTGIGDTFAQAENAWLWKSLRLLEICRSSKITADVSVFFAPMIPSRWRFEGTSTIYQRIYFPSLPSRDWYQPPDALSNARRHWAELLALTVQQLR